MEMFLSQNFLHFGSFSCTFFRLLWQFPRVNFAQFSLRNSSAQDYRSSFKIPGIIDKSRYWLTRWEVVNHPAVCSFLMNLIIPCRWFMDDLTDCVIRNRPVNYTIIALLPMKSVFPNSYSWIFPNSGCFRFLTLSSRSFKQIECCQAIFTCLLALVSPESDFRIPVFT